MAQIHCTETMEVGVLRCQIWQWRQRRVAHFPYMCHTRHHTYRIATPEPGTTLILDSITFGIEFLSSTSYADIGAGFAEPISYVMGENGLFGIWKSLNRQSSKLQVHVAR